ASTTLATLAGASVDTRSVVLLNSDKTYAEPDTRNAPIYVLSYRRAGLFLVMRVFPNDHVYVMAPQRRVEAIRFIWGFTWQAPMATQRAPIIHCTLWIGLPCPSIGVRRSSKCGVFIAWAGTTLPTFAR